MSVISVILLLVAGLAVALAASAVRALHGLREEVAALRHTFAGPPADRLVNPRPVPDEEIIRAAVTDALADERERELAEARAFWAEQEARHAGHTGPLLAGRGLEYRVSGGDEPDDTDELLLEALLEGCALGDLPGTTHSGNDAEDHWQRPGDSVAFVPRQASPDRAPAPELSEEGESAELSAARRRHPSHPGYTLAGEPVEQNRPRSADAASATDGATGRSGSDAEADGEETAEERLHTRQQLAQLAESRTPLADVRPGPLGTLDIYLFEDGTTLCMSPGHQEIALRLAAAVREGSAPVLMGGSGISGAYALTFSCGDDSVYLLADRVVTA
ncbi:hypothetical protein PJ985_06425 [Streptomyces sp. ACA25]|uniref:hypothetical protein n=1 Tax=Streptomyces sp. ACA25 TaxID=3022596 RepID=UPI002307B315|nr:hypothetical protein [Streptomyces sp. ACA25]MDB1087204.1 hypothetical protein [Streptomyces sp. ACA25]